MPYFDTSALVPLFVADHPHHRAAQKAFSAGHVLLHPCVISEFTTVMRRILKDRGEDGNAEARRALAALLRQPRVSIRADVDHTVAAARYLSDPSLSYTDVVLAASGDLVSFDDRLA